jgi:hypothetical protein
MGNATTTAAAGELEVISRRGNRTILLSLPAVRRTSPVSCTRRPSAMSELPFQKQAELWGQAYEVLVKRGVLACLVETQVRRPRAPQLTP